MRKILQRHAGALILAAAMLAAAMPFVQTLRDPFVSDDWHLLWIAAHPTQPLWQYFVTNYEGGMVGSSYRPLVNVFWTALWTVAGMETWPYRAALLAFHLGCVALVFRLARQTSEGGRSLAFAGLAAFLFAFFPNHAEPVAWVGAAVDPIATFFSLLSISLFLDARRKGRMPLYAAALLAFAFALLEKESAIVVPAVLGVWELLHLPRERRGRGIAHAVRRLLPFAALFALYAIVRFRATGVFFGYYGQEHLAIDPMVAVRTYLAIAVSHLLSGAWRTDVMGWLYAVVDTRWEAALIAAGALTLLAALRVRRGAWWYALSFALAIVPVMQFGLNHLPGRVTDEGERYAYLPSAFMALLLGAALVRLWSARLAAARFAYRTGVIALLVFLAAELLMKTALWHATSGLGIRLLDAWHEKYAAEPVLRTATVGLPDNVRGVPVWRNGFAQALDLRYGIVDTVVMPGGRTHAVSQVRTVVDDQHRFVVDAETDGVYTYRSISGEPDIVGPARAPDAWKEELGKAWIGPGPFSIYALTYREFSDEAHIRMRDWRPDALFFWDGTDGWIRK